MYAHRSVFGGTVGPNPMKPANPTDPQYYEGIKVRAQPLIISIQQPSNPKANTTTSTKGQQARRKSNQTVVVSPVKPPTALTVVADNTATDGATPISPASPILKAQLSAPPKQRETVVTPITSKGDMKSQVLIDRRYTILEPVNEYYNHVNIARWKSLLPIWGLRFKFDWLKSSVAGDSCSVNSGVCKALIHLTF
ncbi:hypothetical protein NQ318_013408 [Aromia moschata]|uniref:Uncharacterized protein n=1 Tax=Aromia moschata TaxID=1265417 RepID=A0AAV8YNI2_9CUCU|nr:hypothetical protein NQ318_013408 [Aromia moschata]